MEFKTSFSSGEAYNMQFFRIDSMIPNTVDSFYNEVGGLGEIDTHTTG